ncbi:hypothetical protein Tco_0290987 [Tanacetum coccineum]
MLIISCSGGSDDASNIVITGSSFQRPLELLNMKVEVLEKLIKDLEQARKKEKELVEEAMEKEKKLDEEKLETFKEEIIKEMNDKFAEVLTQLQGQPHTPHST